MHAIAAAPSAARGMERAQGRGAHALRTRARSLDAPPEDASDGSGSGSESDDPRTPAGAGDTTEVLREGRAPLEDYSRELEEDEVPMPMEAESTHALYSERYTLTRDGNAGGAQEPVQHYEFLRLVNHELGTPGAPYKFVVSVGCFIEVASPEEPGQGVCRNVMRVVEIYSTGSAGREQFFVVGEWMYRVRDTLSGGVCAGTGGGVLPLPDASPRRLLLGDSEQTLPVATVERIVRVCVLDPPLAQRLVAAAKLEAHEWLSAADMEAALMKEFSDAPLDYWCDGTYEKFYGRIKHFPRLFTRPVAPVPAPQVAEMPLLPVAMPPGGDDELLPDEMPPGFPLMPVDELPSGFTPGPPEAPATPPHAVEDSPPTLAAPCGPPPAPVPPPPVVDDEEADDELPPGFSHAPQKELVVVDLFCGAGGASLGLAQALLASRPGLRFKTKFGLDADAAALETFAAAHPQAIARHAQLELQNAEIDGLVRLRRMANARADDGGGYGSNEEILSHGVFEQDDGGHYLPPGFPVTHRRWPGSSLVFRVLVRQQAPHAGGVEHTSWMPLEELFGCSRALSAYVSTALAASRLPMPGEVDVLVGGPPCQGFSADNRNRSEDGDVNTSCMDVMVDSVLLWRPLYAFIENVVDVLKFRNGRFACSAMQRLVEAGFQLSVQTHAAAGFGCAQTRVRVFIVAAAPGMRLPRVPMPTHDVHHMTRDAQTVDWRETILAAYTAGDARAQALLPAATVEDAWSDLDCMVTTNDETCEERARIAPPRTAMQAALARPRHGVVAHPPVYNHVPPSRLKPLNMVRVKLVRTGVRGGANVRDILDAVRATPALGVCRINGRNREVVTLEMARMPARMFRRPCRHGLVPTVTTATDVSAGLHYTQHRLRTIREAARLQGFPDWVRVYGSRTEQMRQLGNAIAPPVMRALGIALLDAWPAWCDGASSPPLSDEDYDYASAEMQVEPWYGKDVRPVPPPQPSEGMEEDSMDEEDDEQGAPSAALEQSAYQTLAPHTAERAPRPRATVFMSHDDD